MDIKNKEDIKFSIIIPIYNSEKYINVCLTSIINQTYCNYEVIIVNDGSTDSSGDICNKYSEKYPKIRTFHKENGGTLHSRVFGLKYTMGDYIIYLDSDDYLNTDALSILYSKIKQYNADCIIYGMNRVSGDCVSSWSDYEAESLIYDKREIYRKCLFSQKYNSMCRKAVKRNIFKDIDYKPYFHLKYGEDLLQSLDVINNSKNVLFIDDRLYNYCINPNSITNSNRLENYSNDFSLRERILKLLEESHVFVDEDYTEYRSYCIVFMIDRIFKICNTRASYKCKKQLLKELSEQEYCKKFLFKGKCNPNIIGNRYILYYLLKHNHYNLVLIVVQMYIKFLFPMKSRG